MVQMTIRSKKERTEKWDIRFLNLCKHVAQWSKDPSTKCGSVIVRDSNKVVSLGYNGYASGVDDDDSLHIREQKYAKVLHAEANALLLAKRDISGMTLYCWPFPPCSNCAALIIQSGIERVVTVATRDKELMDRWSKSNRISLEMFRNAEVEFALYSEDNLS